jgi:hypothetical protein
MRLPLLMAQLTATSTCNLLALDLACIQHQAVAPNPPKRLATLLQLLQYRGLTLCDPADRKGYIPFFVPLAQVNLIALTHNTTFIASRAARSSWASRE